MVQDRDSWWIKRHRHWVYWPFNKRWWVRDCCGSPDNTKRCCETGL